MAALEAIPRVYSDFLSAYTPDYGFTAIGIISPLEMGVDNFYIIERVGDLLIRLNTTVLGLDEGDWLSIGFESRIPNEGANIVIRMRFDQPDSLEVWVDGAKQ